MGGIRVQEKVIIFGGQDPSYADTWGITADLKKLTDKVGLSFIEIPHADILDRYTAVMNGADTRHHEAAQALARDLLAGQTAPKKSGMAPAPSEESCTKATALYTVLETLRASNDAQAVTIHCMPWIQAEDLPTPCIALMLFQDAGIPAACQSDVDAMTLMVMIRRVSGRIAFMGGAVKSQGVLGVQHCVMSRNMTGSHSQPYRLSNYHGRKDTPTVWTRLPVGSRVTVCRLAAEARELYLTTGTVLSCLNHNIRCRNTIAIKGPPREKLFQTVKGIQNHFVVAAGDISSQLTEEAQRLDIQVTYL